MLNEQQTLAVNHREGAAIVIAGAGSGKTRVLTYRIAELLLKGVPPSAIFVTTFTNKAVAEIRERASNLTNKLSEGIWLGTFHSLAIRILRENLELSEDGLVLTLDTKSSKYGELSWDKSFTVYDSGDSRSLFYEIASRKGYEREDIYFFEEIVSKMRNEGYGLGLIENQEQYPETCIELFWETLEEYALNNSLGYDEILWVCAALLKSEPIPQALLQHKIQHILIDECQDLNLIQHYLTTLIFFGNESNPKEHDYSGVSLYGEPKSRSLFLVGDVDQAIYSWRGAKPELMIEFPEKFGATVYRIEENYRSLPSIVEAANRLISFNTMRLEKTLRPTRKNEPNKINWSWTHDEYIESQNVAKTIKKMMEENNIDPNNIAILYRTNKQSHILGQALAGQGIPYKVLDGLKFFDRKEVKDVLTYLRLSINPDDSIAIERTINTPRRGIGGQTLSKLKKLAELRKISLWKILDDLSSCGGIVKGKALIALREYVGLITRLQGIALSEDLVETICQETGYDKYLETINDPEEQENRKSNLEELQNTINKYLELNPSGSIGKFLETATLDAGNQRKENIGQQAVSLLTIHSAKGLEFPVIFLTGLEEKTLPHFRSTNPEEIEEERRLCYVAVTRAKDWLFLSGAEFRDNRFRFESQFVQELKRR